MKKLFVSCALILIFASCLTMDQGSGVLPEKIMAQIRASVFEVVVKKPFETPETEARKIQEGREDEIFTDPCTYDGELPWYQMDYNNRIAEYESIGTAFAVSETELATAAHVIDLLYDTYYSDYYIRTKDGKLYEIDKVTRYSYKKDVLYFTVKNSPGFTPLTLNETVTLDTQAFSVGNALGKGIVIREGIVNGEEPEPESGEFNYVLFSAPASPGNSGGPLINRKGEVLGIIQMNTENENLNYALPVSQMLAVSPEKADIKQSSVYVYANTPKKYGPYLLDGTIYLPEDYKKFREQFTRIMKARYAEMVDGYFKKYGNQLFPNGKQARKLFSTLHPSSAPGLATEGEDKNWFINVPEDVRGSDIGETGYLKHVTIGKIEMGYLHLPDELSIQDVIRDEDLFIRTFLDGYTLYRYMGDAQIRIVDIDSLLETKRLTDRYGRVWFKFAYGLPLSDSMIMTYCMPTPDGFVFLNYLGDRGRAMYEFGPDMEVYINYLFYSYEATFEQWKKFLTYKDLLPSLFKSVSFKYDGQSFDFASRFFGIHSGAEGVFVPKDNSILSVMTCFLEQDSKVVWDVQSVYLREEDGKGDSYMVIRSIDPTVYAGVKDKTKWLNTLKEEAPFNRKKTESEGVTTIMGIDEASKQRALSDDTTLSDALMLVVRSDGSVDDEKMNAKLSRLETCLSFRK